MHWISYHLFRILILIIIIIMVAHLSFINLTFFHFPNWIRKAEMNISFFIYFSPFFFLHHLKKWKWLHHTHSILIIIIIILFIFMIKKILLFFYSSFRYLQGSRIIFHQGWNFLLSLFAFHFLGNIDDDCQQNEDEDEHICKNKATCKWWKWFWNSKWSHKERERERKKIERNIINTYSIHIQSTE